ncbi:MAG TPA: alpha/beta hydrolase [Kofleriaceae bacterium]|nr:alpha/beta hydrolase [Kofleriaceae bacterium]
MAHARRPASAPGVDSARPVVQQRFVTMRDGTRIGYQVAGDGPCIVLANGLGGTHVAYRALFQAFRDYKLICWDYRGLFSSMPPADPRANTVAHQVGDLVEILAHEGIGDVVVVGWSMGVQVALETLRHHGARVKGMYAINGTYGRTFSSVMGSQLVGRTIPMIVKLLRAQAGLVGFGARRIAPSYALVAAMRRAGLVSRTVDVEHFRAVAGGFADVDWVIYSDLMARLDEHDAEAVLAAVDVPLTIVTGDQDRLIPASTSERMHRAIAGSRLVVIEGGTHYTPVEFPDVIVDELGKLLDRVPGWQRR